MSELITKPKTWTEQFCDLEIGDALNFPLAKERSIRAMLSGSNKNSPRNLYPDRKFETKTVDFTDPASLIESKVLQVKRIA